MKFKAAIAALDRPGSRWLLSSVATQVARRTNGSEARIFYDECWIHRFDGDYLAEWKPMPREDLRYRRDSRRDRLFFLYTPQPGDIALDLGAGNGLDALILSRAVGQAGRVLAIEAHPYTYLCLNKTCEYNRLSNVTTIMRAVVDESGKEISIGNSEGHVGNSVVDNGTDGIRVPADSIDHICQEFSIDRIDFLKMNIEGAEQLALRGMDDMIRRMRFICVGCHDFKADKTGNEFFRTKQIVKAFLQDNHFELFDFPHGQPWHRDHVHGFNTALVDPSAVAGSMALAPHGKVDAGQQG